MDDSVTVETIKLKDDNGNVYSELITIHNVYVPTVISTSENVIDHDLKVFSMLFSMKNVDEMKQFLDSYSTDILGEMLTDSYNKAIFKGNLNSIREWKYFDMKITEKDITEAGNKGYEEERKESFIKGIINILSELVCNGIISPIEATKRAKMSLSEFNKLAGMTS